MRKRKLLGLLVLCLWARTIVSAQPVINLAIEYKTVYFAGIAKQAIAVNQQIPAPTLHFKEGEKVTINVYNKLDQGTALHWHGILVPWQMDGVDGVTQTAIPPGGVFHYQFRLRQSGTYWYHAHTDLQEQQGLYGAFIIDPKKPSSYAYTKDYVVVLSDWINSKPEQVLANLKKSGDYYAPRFPLQSSLAKFMHDYQQATKDERKQLLADYKMMQQMRMSLYDLSDVAYDAFLLNGQPKTKPWTALVHQGDVVRLRFIGASAATIFRIKIPDSRMRVIQADGNDVRPYPIQELNLAPGETFDVLLQIQKNKPYIIYAESRDKVGAIYGALITKDQHQVNYQHIEPFPEPQPVTRDMMSFMMGNAHTGTLPTLHGGKSSAPNKMKKQRPGRDINMPMMMGHDMNMPTEPTRKGDLLAPPDASYKTSMGSKYDALTAAIPTNDPNKPIEAVIQMELFGYMGQFIWFINGEPEYRAHPILLKPGKRYRFIFSNTSMMHHPMHIHGHWFILRMGQNEFDPLLHTIDVPPGATMTADVDTDASGQWFFHCHMLYHMVTGMSRVFQYTTLLELTRGQTKPQEISNQGTYHNRPLVRIDELRPINTALVNHPMAHRAGLWRATFLDLGEDPFHNVQFITYKGLYGPDYNKLSLFTNDAEISKGRLTNADIDVFYWHLLNQFWAIKGGINYFNRPTPRPYWQPGIGLEGLMPFFIDTDIRAYLYGGSVKLDVELSRDTQISNNFFVRTGIRSILASKTVVRAAIGSGLNQMRYIIRPYYRLIPGLNVFVEYENEHDYGVFKRLEQHSTVSSVENTVTVGLSVLL